MDLRPITLYLLLAAVAALGLTASALPLYALNGDTAITQQNSSPVPNPDGYTAQQLLALPAPTLGAGTTVGGQLLSTMPTDVTLSGTTPIPKGSHQVNAAPGAALTLPAGAIVGTTEYVSDYTGGAGSSPITVAPSSDAGIVGTSGSFSLTVPYQATGFRRTATAWQPY